MPFYEKGDVKIYYEDTGGSGFPLLVIPGGGLNSTVEGLKTHPFNPLVEFKDEFRVIAADLPGSVRSEPQPRVYTSTDFEDDARSFAALLQHLRTGI